MPAIDSEVLIAGGMNRPVDYDATQPIFTGDVQLEENEDGFVMWDSDYSDLSSPKSKELIDKIAPKVVLNTYAV